MGSIPVAGAKKPNAMRWAFWHPHGEPISASGAKRNWVRILRPKIDKLACQAQGVSIFAKGEIPGLKKKKPPLRTCDKAGAPSFSYNN